MPKIIFTVLIIKAGSFECTVQLRQKVKSYQSVTVSNEISLGEGGVMHG